MSTLGRAPANSVMSADDIADNSINAAKVIDGSIDVADLSSSVVTTTGTQTLTNKTLTTCLPAGCTIQTKFTWYSTQYALTSTIAATGLHDSITITSGNKIKINITYNLRTYAHGSCSWLSPKTYLYKSTDGGSSYADMQIGGTQGWASHYRDFEESSQDHAYHDGVYPMLWLDDSPGATTVHYKLYAKLNASGGTHSAWMSADSYYPCTIMLEEIQG